jgi:hypothetical protein
LDHDVKPSDGFVVDRMLPFLYAENRDNPIFTIPKFFLHLLRGAIHCAINFFFIIYLYQYDSVNDHGKMGGLWFISVNLFTSILIVVTVDLIIFTKYHTWINWAIIAVFTILAYIIFVICVHHVTMFKSVGTIATAFGSPRFWMSIIFVCATCAMIDYFILGFNYIFKNSLTKILQRLFNQRGYLNDEYNLPKCIGDRINRYKVFEQQKYHNENELYKIPQNADVLSDTIQENNGNVGINNFTNIQPPIPQDTNGYVEIKNFTTNPAPIPQDNNGYFEIKNTSIKPPFEDNYMNIKNKINYLNSANNNNGKFLNDITNSNMNMNLTTNQNLFNNQEEDDLDIYPNYPKPSLGAINNNFH